MVFDRGVFFLPSCLLSIIDGLLNDLNSCGVGCYWGCSFAGAFSYADDVVLLAPCASAMRIMLEVCRSFAVSHELEFNASKTQLICFYAPSVAPITPSIYFNSTLLSYSNQVIHLGHILTNNLNDTKANFVLCTFHAADPFVKTFLLQSYCLSLYGCCLWSLNSPSISLIEIALNKILRKIWHLPPRSHTAIVHCVAQVDTISNLLYKRFQSFLSRSLSSSSPLINTIFKVFNNEDFCIASIYYQVNS